MNTPHRLTVWRKADLLVQRLCVTLPSEPGAPHADLVDRVRRMAVDLVLAIGSGSRSVTATEFADHIARAITLAHEVEYLLTVLQVAGRVADAECARLLARTDQVQRMLAGLLRTLEQGVRPPVSGRQHADSENATLRRRRRRPLAPSVPSVPAG